MPTTTQCPVCKHYRGEFKCDAFPRRIPQEILSGEHDHREPFKGDNGIRFELPEGVTEADLGLE